MHIFFKKKKISQWFSWLPASYSIVAYELTVYMTVVFTLMSVYHSFLGPNQYFG